MVNPSIVVKTTDKVLNELCVKLKYLVFVKLLIFVLLIELLVFKQHYVTANSKFGSFIMYHGIIL